MYLHGSMTSIMKLNGGQQNINLLINVHTIYLIEKLFKNQFNHSVLC